MLSIRITGCSIHSCTSVARIAAPVGVVSSPLSVVGASGAPSSNFAVAGAGIGMVAVFVFFGGGDVDLGCREAALPDLLELQTDRQAKGGKESANAIAVGAGIEEGGERHVAADAAETVEMERSHCESSFAEDS